jgi:hypothetical protein
MQPSGPPQACNGTALPLIGKSRFNFDSPIQRTNLATRITDSSAFEAGKPQHFNAHCSVSPTLSLICQVGLQDCSPRQGAQIRKI